MVGTSSRTNRASLVPTVGGPRRAGRDPKNRSKRRPFLDGVRENVRCWSGSDRRKAVLRAGTRFAHAAVWEEPKAMLEPTNHRDPNKPREPELPVVEDPVDPGEPKIPEMPPPVPDPPEIVGVGYGSEEGYYRLE